MLETDFYILAIDPGNKESAFVLLDRDLRPLDKGKVKNEDLRSCVASSLDLYKTDEQACVHLAIEMIASYGMAVGADVFETCVWIGRFIEQLSSVPQILPAWMVYRKSEKTYLCGSPRATDTNIIQALVDRFAPGQPNHGKGTKKDPGWFYGFKKDIWQAYAVGVTFYDMQTGRF